MLQIRGLETLSAGIMYSYMHEWPLYTDHILLIPKNRYKIGI